MAPPSAPPIINTLPDISKPRYDQTQYWGRVKHHFGICNPLMVFSGANSLEKAKALVEAHKAGTLARTSTVTGERLWEAKALYDSAYHPDTGEKVFLPARMSFQAWGNMGILGATLTLYRSVPGLMVMQVVNQSFNALVTYCNRNASVAERPLAERGAAFAAAVGGTTGVVVVLRRFLSARPALDRGIWPRLLPFAMATVGNCINVPLMRIGEIQNGIAVMDGQGNEVGTSKIAARLAVAQTVMSRIAMAAPACIGSPIVMQALERRNVLGVAKSTFRRAIMTTGVAGVMFTFATPCACAVFNQKQSVSASSLEPHIANAVPTGGRVWYNKGL